MELECRGALFGGLGVVGALGFETLPGAVEPALFLLEECWDLLSIKAAGNGDDQAVAEGEGESSVTGPITDADGGFWYRGHIALLRG